MDTGLRDAATLLRTYDEPVAQVLDHVAAVTRVASGAECAGLYCLEPAVASPADLVLAFGHWSGLALDTRSCNEVVAASVNRAGSFAAYDVVRPAPRERDRVVSFPSPAAIAASHGRALRRRTPGAVSAEELAERMRRHAATFRALGIEELRQGRMLVCDGARLLAWFGVFSSRALGARGHRVLHELAPSLRRRLRLERELRLARRTDAVLGLTMEAIGAPAVLFDEHDAIVHANELGRELLDGPDATLREQLTRPRDGAPAPGTEWFEVKRVGIPALRLVVLRSDVARGAARRARIAKEWHLTPRELQVLDLVVNGQTNADIALTLRCAESTVEIHVGRILRKANVLNRASLAARYWNPA